jgi:hypothetical protein
MKQAMEHHVQSIHQLAEVLQGEIQLSASGDVA